MLSIVPGRASSARAEVEPAVVVPLEGADDPWGLAPDDLPAPDLRVVLPPSSGSPSDPDTGQQRAVWKAGVVMALVLAVVAAAGTAVWMLRARPAAAAVTAAAPTGVLILSSHPPGATVVADGQARGTTPLALTLTAGAHELVLTAAGRALTETLQVATTAGQTTSQHVVFAVPPTTTGAVEVEASRLGAEVLVDGVVAGVTPLTLQGIAPGPHEIAVRVSGRTVTRTVDVQPGITTSLVLDAPTTAAVPIPGWLQLATPFPVEAYEGGRLLGVSRSDRIMVNAGRHAIELVNDGLGFRTSTTVTVEPGKTATVPLEAPLAPVSINALPWAEVDVDGQRYGETPIGTLMLPIGDRTVTLRHPTLGVRVETFTVRLGGPNRLSVSMRP